MAVDWQPIETAPSDGTWVILLRPSAAHPRRVISADFMKGGVWWHTRPATLEQPTHWMPIPALAKEKSGGG